MAELWHHERPAGRAAAGRTDDDLRPVQFFFQLTGCGVRQDIAADAGDLLDLVLNLLGVIALAIGMSQLPIAGKTTRTIDDARTATGVQAPQPELGILRQ